MKCKLTEDKLLQPSTRYFDTLQQISVERGRGGRELTRRKAQTQKGFVRMKREGRFTLPLHVSPGAPLHTLSVRLIEGKSKLHTIETKTKIGKM